MFPRAGQNRGRWRKADAAVFVLFLFSVLLFCLFSYHSNSGLINMNILKIKGLHTHHFCTLVFQLTSIFISGEGFGAQLVLVTKTQLFPTSLQSFTGTCSTKLITCFCCCRSRNQKVCMSSPSPDLSAGL